MTLNFARKILSLLFPAVRYARFSYSQEGEDLLLMSVFENHPQDYKGFYVDIGAHHPFRFSNTWLFYEKGWSGINIDATPGSMKPFRQYRERDVNLEMGVGSKPGRLIFYCFNEPALNTFDESTARRRVGKFGYQIKEEIEVKVASMETMLDEMLPPGKGIDFLTIDVEGLDHDVLLSNNWEKYRPHYILVESLIKEGSKVIDDYLTSVGYHLEAQGRLTMIYKDRTYNE
jgi:FkbM family methyltransferase